MTSSNSAGHPIGPELPTVDPATSRGQALTFLHAAAQWRQLAILRCALVDDLVRERDELRSSLEQARAALHAESTQPNGADPALIAPRRAVMAAIDRALAYEETTPKIGFQDRVLCWLVQCFGPRVAGDAVERQHRFFEEAGELVQACGMTAHEAHQLVDYTWGRPAGQPFQEAGGVLLTLAGLCSAKGIELVSAGETELTRVSSPSLMEAIRTKQAAKPKNSPLPIG